MAGLRRLQDETRLPDELRGEVIEAFVVARDAAATGPDLVTELQDWVKKEFAKHAYPRRIHFVDTLPKTPSGKIQRFLLRKDRAEPKRFATSFPHPLDRPNLASKPDLALPPAWFGG